MKIVYRLCEEDSTEAYNLFGKGERLRRRFMRRISPWMDSFVAIVGIVGAIVTRGEGLFLLLAVIGIYFLYRDFALRRHFKARYKTDRRYNQDFSAEISDDGIRVLTPFEDSRMKWGSIVRYLESDKIFMLFHSTLIFTIIPKRAFASGEAHRFRELLGRNIQASK
jgi:hypothetical protein